MRSDAALYACLFVLACFVVLMAPAFLEVR